MAGPMDGITVVELGVWVAGPATGGILADWGADVVKIEPPTATRAERSDACSDSTSTSARRSRWTTGPSAASSSI